MTTSLLTNYHYRFVIMAEKALEPMRALLRNQHQLYRFKIRGCWEDCWGKDVYDILRAHTTTLDYKTVLRIREIVKLGLGKGDLTKGRVAAAAGDVCGVVCGSRNAT